MGRIKLVSSGLNEILVKQHTMSDIIRVYNEEKYEFIEKHFERQKNGEISINEALVMIGLPVKKLTLKQLLEYVRTKAEYMPGLEDFITRLHEEEIPLIINSTTYSVILYAFANIVGLEKVDGYICNSLVFTTSVFHRNVVNDWAIKEFVETYFEKARNRRQMKYNHIKTTGQLHLGIKDEKDKAEKLKIHLGIRHEDVNLEEVVHIGSTMTDGEAIFAAAQNGGLGIAFNYNVALEEYLRKRMKLDTYTGDIEFICKRGEGDADLGAVLPIILRE